MNCPANWVGGGIDDDVTRLWANVTLSWDADTVMSEYPVELSVP